MRNILIYARFIGTKYCGTQVQKNGVAVSFVIQAAKEKIIREKCDIKCCGRLDSGVSAKSFPISFKTSCTLPLHTIQSGINAHLPHDIVIFDIKDVDEDFHARYSAHSKIYVYKFYDSRTRDPFCDGFYLHSRKRIDTELLGAAAREYVGSHDFSAFCGSGSKIPKDERTREVYSAEITRDGGKVYFTVAANGFLYKMVRIMAGCLLLINDGRLTVEKLREILETGDRGPAKYTAPSYALELREVKY